MADTRDTGRPEGREPHPLVSKLTGDGGQPPNTVTLHGYLGQDPAEGEWLLWLNLSFTDSVQGRDDDLVHTETLPDDRGTILYVKADAKLQYRHVETQSVEASFLGGGISSGAMAPSGAAAPVAGGAAMRPFPPSLLWPCQTAVRTRCMQVSCGIACTADCTDWRCQTEAPFHCWTSPFVCRTEPARCEAGPTSLGC